MKKVLIIADLFHASPRIPSLAKYFPEFGWNPVILTGNLPESSDQKFDYIKTPFPNNFDNLKKIFRLNSNRGFQEQLGIPLLVRENSKSFCFQSAMFFRSIVSYPDEHRFWKSYALKAAHKLFHKEKIDAIISSSSPVTAHLIARELKNIYKVPWIADFRDLWTQNHNYHFGKIRKYFETKLELKTIKTADALVTVSPLWVNDLSIFHRKKADLITNGFDPCTLDIKNNLTSKFTITYTGPIYTGKQNTKEFLCVLKKILDKDIDPIDIDVKFYGPKNQILQNEIETCDLADTVKQYGLIPRKNAFQKQRESQLLLLLYWNDPKVNGWYPLKIFEYLAARRPVLVVGGSGGDVVEKLISSANAGIYCKNKMEIEQALLKYYSEFKQKGKIHCYSNVLEIEKYSYRESARKFTKILDNLT